MLVKQILQYHERPQSIRTGVRTFAIRIFAESNNIQMRNVVIDEGGRKYDGGEAKANGARVLGLCMTTLTALFSDR